MPVHSRFLTFFGAVFFYCDSYLLAKHVYFATKKVPRCLFLVAERLQNFDTAVKCLLPISTMRLTASRNGRFQQVFDLFWHSFFIRACIYGQTMYYAQKMSPDVFSWLTFHTPLKKGPHRLLNWQIQVTRVSWIGQSTRGGGCIQNLANYASLMALWLSCPAQTHFESDHCGDRSTQFSSLLNRKHEG